MADRRRVGILGGTFDPVHVGHLVAAENARFACALDEVLFVVANQPWQKTEQKVAPAELRFAAVQAAVADRVGLAASRIEIDRGGVTFTAETLRELRSHDPDAHLFLIVGTDTAERLDTWREPEMVAELADLVVVNRPGVARRELPAMWRVHDVEIPALDVSSTDLRRRLADGRPVDFLIPDGAAAVLRSSGLYAGLQDGRKPSD